MGNLIAEGNAEKIRKVFNELFSLRMLIAGTICFTPVSYTHLDVYKSQAFGGVLHRGGAAGAAARNLEQVMHCLLYTSR